MKEIDHELGKYDYCSFLRKNPAVCAQKITTMAI